MYIKRFLCIPVRFCFSLDGFCKAAFTQTYKHVNKRPKTERSKATFVKKKHRHLSLLFTKIASLLHCSLRFSFCVSAPLNVYSHAHSVAWIETRKNVSKLIPRHFDDAISKYTTSKFSYLKIAGSLMAASCLQFFLGITGLLGFIMNFIGPMTIIPTVSLIGFSIFEQATRAAQHQWGICAL